MENAQITAIVPVYNNQKTIRRVTEILLKCSFFTEIIVVNDASQDNSSKILKKIKKNHPASKKLKILNLTHNHGKAPAIEKAISISKTPIIMNIDADLAKLKKEHVFNLKNAFFKSGADLVIAAKRYHPDLFLRQWFVDSLAGERIFYKKNIQHVRKLLRKNICRGYEQVINFAHRNKKIKMIYAYETGHIMKYSRYPKNEIYKIPKVYFKEGWELFKTFFLIQKHNFASKYKNFR